MRDDEGGIGLGLVVSRVQGVRQVVGLARQAEELGYGCAWLTSGASEDCIAMLAVLASETERIQLGTAVVQTYLRHPVILAQEANVVSQVAPGRVRLGIGPSHRVVMESLGVPFADAAGHLREYLAVLAALHRTGSVAFSGRHLDVTTSLAGPVPVPILVGAIQTGTFRLAGELADGAVSWLCPPAYLRDVAIPAMAAAAADAERPCPPTYAHLTVCLHDDADDVYDAVGRSIPNITLPSYQKMLVRAGLAEAAGGVWTGPLVDELIAWGSEDRIAARVAAMAASGAAELVIRPLGAGPDPAAVIDRTVRFVATLGGAAPASPGRA